MINRFRIQRKLMNISSFIDLVRMNKHYNLYSKSLERKQNRRIRRLMKRAYNIPFYRERFDSTGVKPEDIRNAADLQKLPILTKDDLRKWMESESVKPENKYCFTDTTSGSTGKPLTLLYSPREKANNIANWLRMMMEVGFNPFFGVTMSRLDTHGSGEYGVSVIQKIGILRRVLVDEFASPEEQVENLNRYKPDFFYINRSDMFCMCLYCKENGVEVHKPKFYAPIAEKISEQSEQLFREVLGDGMVDAYGSAETGTILVKRPGSSNYYFHNDSYVLNIYDEANHLADEGKVIVTPLFKTDFPLINYQIGDLVCSHVVNGNRIFTDILGRMNDLFKYENGEVQTFYEIHPVIASCTDLYQIRFIQKTYKKLLIQCVKKQNESGRTKAEIEQYLERALNEHFKQPFEMDFEWLPVLPPDEHGKLRVLISEVE